MKKLTDNIAIIGPVRFSYLNVFTARENKLRKEKEFSTVVLIPKVPNAFCPNPTQMLKELRELLDGALKTKFGEVPKKYDSCLKDGDVETDNDGDPKHPGYWFMSTRAGEQYPPTLIDGARKPVLDPTTWVSGDWGFAKLSFFAYEYEGRKGVSAGLRALQFTKKDEPFGSAIDADAVANEFDEVEESFLA